MRRKLEATDFQKFLSSPIGDSQNFFWEEALYLPKWEIHVMPEHPDVFASIIETAGRMQQIRTIFDCPITVLSWFRPIIYNQSIKGAQRSSHIFGMACDFMVKNLDADDARKILLPKLEILNIRMEDLPGSNWVHIDINCTDKTPVEKRFFNP